MAASKWTPVGGIDPRDVGVPSDGSHSRLVWLSSDLAGRYEMPTATASCAAWCVWSRASDSVVARVGSMGTNWLVICEIVERIAVA